MKVDHCNLLRARLTERSFWKDGCMKAWMQAASWYKIKQMDRLQKPNIKNRFSVLDVSWDARTSSQCYGLDSWKRIDLLDTDQDKKSEDKRRKSIMRFKLEDCRKSYR